MAARAGRAWVVGITGVPGSGKSTLVDALLGAWLAQGHTIAVIAIDPSSPISGGAVLGDRIRMGANAAHENVFIRSFSARGELGGLSRAARAAVDCFDACGFDRVIVETVGTGQSETRDRRARRHARRRLPARPRRRRAGDQGRDARDRRRPRRQQGRPAARRADRARDARDADAAPARAAPATGRRASSSSARSPRTGLDELLAALDAHRAAVGVGRRRRGRRPAGAAAPAGAAPSRRHAGARARRRRLARADRRPGRERRPLRDARHRLPRRRARAAPRSR